MNTRDSALLSGGVDPRNRGFRLAVCRVDANDAPRNVVLPGLGVVKALGKLLERVGVVLQKVAHGDDVLAQGAVEADAGDVVAAERRRVLVHEARKACRAHRGQYLSVIAPGMPEDAGQDDLPAELRSESYGTALVFINGRVIKDRQEGLIWAHAVRRSDAAKKRLQREQ